MAIKSFGWDKLKRFLSQPHTWSGVQTFVNAVIQAYSVMLVIVTDSSTASTPASEMKGQNHVVTGAYTRSLPTAALGYNAIFLASTAAVFSLDLDTGTDVFYLNGSALAAGNKITSDGTIRAEISVKCLISGYYEAKALKGVFVDGGA